MGTAGVKVTARGYKAILDVYIWRVKPKHVQEEICRRKTIGFVLIHYFSLRNKNDIIHTCSNSTLVQMSLELPWGYFQMATGLWLGPSYSGAISILE